MKPGVQCVMTHGTALMLVWLADSWDSPDTVCYIFCMIANHSINGALQMLWHVPMPSMAREVGLSTLMILPVLVMSPGCLTAHSL